MFTNVTVGTQIPCQWVIKTDVHSSVMVGSTFVDKKREKPINILFKCVRQHPLMNCKVADVYCAAVHGNAHLLLTQNPNSCGEGDVAKHCGHYRGKLTECRCDTLDRIQHPMRRLQFENKVIQAALAIIAQQKESFVINIAIFASGGLHGEEILLFRLFHELRKKQLKGKITLFFIDTDYKKNIEATKQVYHLSKRVSSFSWMMNVGCREDLAQFLHEVSLCLPPEVVVEGAVFGDSDNYIMSAQKNDAYKHHLLIGADIENLVSVVGTIDKLAGWGSAKPIVLIKEVSNQKQELAKLCDVEGTATQNCVELTDTTPRKKSSDGGCVIS